MNSLAILVLLVAVKITGIAWFNRQALPGGFSYVGDDYPRRLPIRWPDQPFVQMPIHDSRRYQLETETADAEWDASLPNDGILYLGEQCQPFSISMFHQIRCLNVLRKAISLVWSQNATMSELGPSRAEFEFAGHCLNYLRSMAFCRSDAFLDPLKGYPIPNGYPDTDRVALRSRSFCT
uniref:Uncharacterized protein n=1 Tax=Mycena chlorophos TaxID=658473 RepID=A0ABQ0LEL4_MYCCL|nr:predicted protein [Mycena chlorophos]